MAASTVAAIGAAADVRGYALAGVAVWPAAGPDAARTAWLALGPQVAVVMVTAEAARAIGPAVDDLARMVVVLPDGGAP
ncbi:hypothetical protein Dvina_32320 [Dactylosporangium vinaceum]|uniref:ATP synthase F subunit n=1 Tax=Dactylosporangium vinaceum TaxID=53362 RepID=A0ABV5MAH1_9ACTN|nr:hypothetical protein [Dactylosporangium vinaceum]UAB92977.1 hypothetical protein Dvina_32320 [Dactylosporangium vinaceum]